MKVIYIGIGEYAVGTKENILQTVLGSCVGVIIFDKFNRIGGLAHIYLPNSCIESKKAKTAVVGTLNAAPKYADVLIPKMIDELIKRGADRKFFSSFLVGGASIFNFHDHPDLNVGQKNLEEAHAMLHQYSIKAVEVKVGGSTGRKVIFNCATGDLEVTEFDKYK